MSSTTTVSFKWLDILEKEFDKAFVNLDMLLGELDVDDTDVIYVAKKQLATLCSCFAQLSHKALTVFQINAKTEAELINLRSEFVQLKTDNQLTRNSLHSVLLQWHSLQLERLPDDSVPEEIADDIKKKLQHDLERRSPVRHVEKDGNTADKLLISLENWRKLLETENKSLRRTVAGLQAEVCAARLAARYLDKELVGRIQQLQLLSKNNMSVELKTKLWDQLDEEILLQRHKTVIKVMQQQQRNRPVPPENITGIVRTVRLYREPCKELGISVTGGKEHDIPVIISDLQPIRSNCDLFIGDAILSVNNINLAKLTHKEAVKILNEQVGDITLTVKSLPHINESEEDQDTVCFGYPFFDECERQKLNKDGATNNSTVPTPQIPVDRNKGRVDDLVTDNDDDKRRNNNNYHHHKSDVSEDEAVGSTNAIPFDGTVLQKIFNAVSTIDKRVVTTAAHVPENSLTTSENCRQGSIKQSGDSRSSSGNHNSGNCRSKTYKNQILPSKHNFPKIIKADTVAEIEDASRGTPV